MSKNLGAFHLTFVTVVISCGVLAAMISTRGAIVKAQGVKPIAAKPQPVDDDMHHFMEYVFEPNYKRLKASMARQSKDTNTWKAIKGDALTLAECANLLLIRLPDEEADKWRKLSVEVRTHGGELYQAARKSDGPSARGAYVKMLSKCNACHQQFAGGEHQLTP